MLCGCRAALLAVWAAEGALLSFALKLKVSAAKSDANGPVPHARLGSFQVPSPPVTVYRMASSGSAEYRASFLGQQHIC